VTISPADAVVEPAGTRQFSATVTGLADTTVTWTATGGSITQAGLFTAGQETGAFSVSATSVADPNSVGIAQITITAILPGHYHGGSPLPFTTSGVPADVVQDCTLHGGEVFMQGTFDYQLTDTGHITGSLGVDAALSGDGALVLIGQGSSQSGNVTVKVTELTSNQIMLELQGNQIVGAFCGEFTLAGIEILKRYGLNDFSIGLSFVGP
jgi:hypothetical protein